MNIEGLLAGKGYFDIKLVSEESKKKFSGRRQLLRAFGSESVNAGLMTSYNDSSIMAFCYEVYKDRVLARLKELGIDEGCITWHSAGVSDDE